MFAPLAGRVSFFAENAELIQEIDMDEYNKITKLEFLEIVHKLGAHKVVLTACYHNYDVGTETNLYEKSDLTNNNLS